MSRRRFLALPALALSQAWPGERMQPNDQIKFVFDVTQLLRQRIDKLQAQVAIHDEIVTWALKHFGLQNPVRKSDGGKV